MLAEPILPILEESTYAALVVVAVVETPVDPLRHARSQVQRSILTHSLLDRVLSCGVDLPSYEKVMREFIWTPTASGR